MQSLQEREKICTLTSNHNFCISTPISKIEMTIFVIHNGLVAETCNKGLIYIASIVVAHSSKLNIIWPSWMTMVFLDIMDSSIGMVKFAS